MLPPLFSELLFWLAAAICLIAQVAVVRAALAGRTPGTSMSWLAQLREFFWVLLPAVVLALVLGWTWRVLPTRASADHAAARHATASAHPAAPPAADGRT